MGGHSFLCDPWTGDEQEKRPGTRSGSVPRLSLCRARLTQFGHHGRTRPGPRWAAALLLTAGQATATFRFCTASAGTSTCPVFSRALFCLQVQGVSKSSPSRPQVVSFCPTVVRLGRVAVVYPGQAHERARRAPCEETRMGKRETAGAKGADSYSLLLSKRPR